MFRKSVLQGVQLKSLNRCVPTIVVYLKSPLRRREKKKTNRCIVLGFLRLKRDCFQKCIVFGFLGLKCDCFQKCTVLGFLRLKRVTVFKSVVLGFPRLKRDCFQKCIVFGFGAPNPSFYRCNSFERLHRDLFLAFIEKPDRK